MFVYRMGEVEPHVFPGQHFWRRALVVLGVGLQGGRFRQFLLGTPEAFVMTFTWLWSNIL